MQLGQVGGRRRIVELAAVEPPGAAAERRWRRLALTEEAAIRWRRSGARRAESSGRSRRTTRLISPVLSTSACPFRIPSNLPYNHDDDVVVIDRCAAAGNAAPAAIRRATDPDGTMTPSRRPGLRAGSSDGEAAQAFSPRLRRQAEAFDPLVLAGAR